MFNFCGVDNCGILPMVKILNESVASATFISKASQSMQHLNLSLQRNLSFGYIW